MVTIGAGANPTVKEEEPIHKPALKDFHRWKFSKAEFMIPKGFIETNE